MNNCLSGLLHNYFEDMRNSQAHKVPHTVQTAPKQTCFTQS